MEDESTTEETTTQVTTEGAPSTEQSTEDIIKDLQNQIKHLRMENGRNRVNAKQTAADEARAALIAEVAKTLGLGGEDKTLTADELKAELEKANMRTRELELREVVRNHAPEGVDPSRLLKFTDFLDAVKGLEPTDTDGIKAAMESVVADNEWLVSAAPTAPKKSGTDMSGGSGEGALTLEKFKAMSGAEKNELFTTNEALYRQLSAQIG